MHKKHLVTRLYNSFMALCPGLSRWAGTRRNTHPEPPGGAYQERPPNVNDVGNTKLEAGVGFPHMNLWDLGIRFLRDRCPSCCLLSTTTVLRPFIQDYQGEAVPEETFIHSPILVIIYPLSASSNYYNP